MTDLTIVPEYIQALGAIYHAAILEEMKAYEVADRLLDLYQQGLLPVSRPGAGDALATYWKRSNGRVPKAERRRVFAQTFGIAAGAAGVSPNREFSDLWMRFVSSASAFARQLETDTFNPKAPRTASQEQLRKAARDLAVNLSLHGFGMAGMAAELSSQIEDLIKALSDPDIQRAYGVRDMTQLVERVSTLELGGAPKRRGDLARAKSGSIVLAWLARRSPALSASNDVLDAAEIESGRRAGDPATTPTDYDLVDACEQWLAVTGTKDSRADDFTQPRQTPEVRAAVRALFANSGAFARLSPAMQSRVARDTALIADHLVPGHADLARRVDFPEFVTDLVTGVFDAIVDASIRQMEAYADLVAAVAASADRFLDENVSDASLREHLCDRFPRLCDPPTPEEERRMAAALDAVAGGTWRRLAKTRQQLLATMVMMGVNRSVGSNGWDCRGSFRPCRSRYGR